MNHGRIRWVDRYVGSILCFGLTLVRRIGDVFGGRKRALLPPSKILFIKLIEQGATVLAYGAIKRAVAKVGRENVFFCVFAENRAIFDLLELVPPENVIEIRSDGMLVFGFDVLRLLGRCRREKIDTTIDMEFMARAPAILAYCSGARRRVGLHRFTTEGPYRGDLMTDRLLPNPFLHTAEHYSLLVQVLDAPPGETPLGKMPVAEIEAQAPRFTPTEEERARIAQLIEGEAGGVVGGPIVLLNPNASDLLPLRKWEAERFVELGRRLIAEQPDVTVAITGAPSERSSAETIAGAIGEPPRVISLAGKTTLRDLLVVYSLADVLVTNDSGPGHFASLTEIHNIVLFGPASVTGWGPRGGRHHVIRADLACSPCVDSMNNRLSPCTDNVCMQSIGVDQVYEEVASCLAQDEAAGHRAGRTAQQTTRST
ncbi:MAG: glycosyltransferase family 9 protein [Thermoanaerobaculia bacterium]